MGHAEPDDGGVVSKCVVDGMKHAGIGSKSIMDWTIPQASDCLNITKVGNGRRTPYNSKVLEFGEQVLAKANSNGAAVQGKRVVVLGTECAWVRFAERSYEDLVIIENFAI